MARTITHGLWYTTSTHTTLVGYTNNDFAGDLNERKSTSRYVFLFGKNLISWASKKQPIVSLSLAEAEYVTATTTTCQGVWLKRILLDFGYTEKDPTTIFCDNVSTIFLSKNNVFHQKGKHIDTQFHFLCELVKKCDITLEFCSSKEQLADVFTKPKPLRRINFEFQRQNLNIKECNT